MLMLALVVAVAAVAAPASAGAQASEPPKVVTPALDFSGVIYANWQQRSDSSARAANAGNASSKFDVERVYLTFKMPAGDRMSIRVTTDIFNGDQSGSSYYKGWTARLKYAYLQWNFANDIGGNKGFSALARFGMLHTVAIDHMEGFFPRWISLTDVERTGGFFSSSDVGAAALVTLPKKMGEVYATITNGTGYGAAENDRFKDFAGRLTLTPLASGKSLLKALAISPYFYGGKTASKFQNGGTGQVGPVSDGLTRNRFGVFVASKDPRLTFGFDYGKRTETTEGGANTTASPRTTTDVTGQLTSGFVMIRPAAFSNPKSSLAKWGVLARIDDFKPDVNQDPANQLLILSLFYEPTSKVSFSLDNQAFTRKNGSTLPETNTLFLHMQASF